MFSIENEHLKVQVRGMGAELQSIYSKTTGTEYLWSGDPRHWAKRSPILFPVVGTLKEDTYLYKDRPYHLTRHGFARDMNFDMTAKDERSVTFTLGSNKETLLKYPFEFELNVIYSLSENILTVQYVVLNKGTDRMYFSIGGHPAFRVPLDESISYEDYYLQFSSKENTGRWPISEQGLIKSDPLDFIKDSDIVRLSHELFSSDAIVLKHLQSNRITLASDKSTHGLNFDFSGFPYLGLWSFKDANFVCIEPWCGIADSVNSTRQLQDKEGINTLNAHETFVRNWSVELF